MQKGIIVKFPPNFSLKSSFRKGNKIVLSSIEEEVSIKNKLVLKVHDEQKNVGHDNGNSRMQFTSTKLDNLHLQQNYNKT